MSTYYKKYLPLKPLENSVRFFYCFCSDKDAAERLLPIGATELTIKFNRDTQNINIYLASPATAFTFENPKTLGEIIGVCFHPWAFNNLFGVPQYEIANTKIPFENVLNSANHKLTGLLQGKTNYPDIIRIIQSYLISILNNKQNGMGIDAVNFINEKKGQVQMSSLYKRYHISERRLQQCFECCIGISPKRYCLLKKFHSAVTQLHSSAHLTDLALNLDYYDQAHFINDFKSFAGVCPSGLLKEKNALNKINADAYFSV